MAPSGKTYFTISEANARVDELRQLFDRVMQIRSQLKALSKSLDEAGHPVTRSDFGSEEDEEDEDEAASAEGGEEDDLPPGVRRNRGHFRALIATLREHIEEIQATGAIIKDIESGLVDWYALHDGREVFLCWQYGEREVAWWHEIHTGFAGRRPIAELLERDQHA